MTDADCVCYGFVVTAYDCGSLGSIQRACDVEEMKVEAGLESPLTI